MADIKSSHVSQIYQIDILSLLGPSIQTEYQSNLLSLTHNSSAAAYDLHPQAVYAPMLLNVTSECYTVCVNHGCTLERMVQLVWVKSASAEACLTSGSDSFKAFLIFALPFWYLQVVHKSQSQGVIMQVQKFT